MALPGSTTIDSTTSSHEMEAQEAKVPPHSLTAWFETPSVFDHSLIRPLGEIRTLLAHISTRIRMKSLENPGPEKQLIPNLLARARDFSALLGEATRTLSHPDLLDWFAGQDWEENRETFSNAFTSARYISLDLTYVLGVIDERLVLLENKRPLDVESVVMAAQIRDTLKEAEGTVSLAYQKLKEHLESLRWVFPEALGVGLEEELETGTFWGRPQGSRGSSDPAASVT